MQRDDGSSDGASRAPNEPADSDPRAPILARQRQALIVTHVRERGVVRVGDLVDRFGVSEMTIRRDLSLLHERGLVEKTHGGAASIEGSSFEPGFRAKSALMQLEKAAIARAAAELVEPGMAVALSAGTTTWTLATKLVDVSDVTVVTNSIPVADIFHARGRPDQTVVLTGGLRTPSDALVGPIAVDALGSLHVDVVFMGVHGMYPRGFTTPNLLEAETNRALIDAGRRLVVLADHTKWGVIGMASIAPLARAETLISDTGLDGAARAELSDVLELRIVDPRSALDRPAMRRTQRRLP
jgi:DeoR/GlpR family transcriptional regulator of sugar metabolism